MVIIDGSFLLGIAAVLTSLGTLWRASRARPAPRWQYLHVCRWAPCDTCLNCWSAQDEHDQTELQQAVAPAAVRRYSPSMRAPDRDKIEFAIIALTIIAAALMSLARLWV